MTSIIDADSLLVLDVGAVTTRAMLFDVVDGRYRFLASGTAPSTAGAPFHDVGEGVRQALDDLQKITGRILVGQDEQPILPSTPDGSGVDAFAATISAGRPLKMVAVGLLEDVSLESASRLASTTYTGLVDTISLNDRRRPEARIDLITRMRPDMVVVAGGTDGGASQSVLKILESVGLACYLMPKDQRPEVLYAGNQELREEVKTTLGSLAELHFAPNVRPILEIEQLEPAQARVADLVTKARVRQMPGVKDLEHWSNGNLLPTSTAFGRLIRFLSKSYKSNKGVLGVDVGASATTLAASFAGNLTMGVYPQFGLGAGMPELLNQVEMYDILRWLPMDIPEKEVVEYAYNKAIYPKTIPVTEEEIAIEQAIAREAIRASLKKIAPGFPDGVAGSGAGTLPWFEPILASGSVLTNPPSLAHSLLMLLDSLQPTGVTTLVLDQNHIAGALGSAASINPVLTVQVLDTNTLLYLGTVISPIANAKPGTPILRVKMTYESGHETSLDVKQGMLEVLPLPLGQRAQVHLQPLHRSDVGMGGPGRGGKLGVHGGVFGVVIDARGRPLRLIHEPGRRREQLKKWLWMLGK